MRLAKFVAGYLLVIFTLIAGLATSGQPQPAEVKLSCQEREATMVA